MNGKLDVAAEQVLALALQDLNGSHGGISFEYEFPGVVTATRVGDDFAVTVVPEHDGEPGISIQAMTTAGVMLGAVIKDERLARAEWFRPRRVLDRVREFYASLDARERRV